MIFEEAQNLAALLHGCVHNTRPQTLGGVTGSAVGGKQIGACVLPGFCGRRRRVAGLASHEERERHGTKYEEHRQGKEDPAYEYVSHRYTMSKRSLWMAPGRTPRERSIVSTLFIIGAGPQMKKW